MSKIVQRRRGTTAEHTTFTGALGELTVDTTKDTIVVHDGAAAGGYPLARENLSNVPAGTVSTAMLANDAVTYAKVQNVSATDKLLGRSTAGAGDVEEITCTAAGRNLLDDADAAAQRTTLGLGTLATQSGTFSGTSSGTNTGDQTITLTGDVTGSGTGSFTTAIAAGVIVDADINASAGIVDTKLATISTAGKVSNSATTATDANTASAIVARDGSGNFTAGTITASLAGNASTVTTNANLTGDVTSVGNATSLPPISINRQTISANYTLDSTRHGSSVGPVAIADGVTVTLNQSTWMIL
jgi:hypothetical protein